MISHIGKLFFELIHLGWAGESVRKLSMKRNLPYFLWSLVVIVVGGLSLSWLLTKLTLLITE